MEILCRLLSQKAQIMFRMSLNAKCFRRETKIITGKKTDQCRNTSDFFHNVINPGTRSGVQMDPHRQFCSCAPLFVPVWTYFNTYCVQYAVQKSKNRHFARNVRKQSTLNTRENNVWIGFKISSQL
jgi:hypothetical protein